MEARFLGIDLGWYGKPSGLVSIELDGARLKQRDVARLQGSEAILEWIAKEAGDGACVAAVDAPLVIPNVSGIREAERGVNRDFRKFHAGCHAANLGRPFAANVLAFSGRLREMGFAHGAEMEARAAGRYQIEVHPHAATVSLFGLDRIVKYKRGLRAERARGLRRLRGLILEKLAAADPPFEAELPPVPRAGDLKSAEDRIDAVMCAYIAAHWWWWGAARNRVYGSNEGGYVVVPGSGLKPAAG